MTANSLVSAICNARYWELSSSRSSADGQYARLRIGTSLPLERRNVFFCCGCSQVISIISLMSRNGGNGHFRICVHFWTYVNSKVRLLSYCPRTVVAQRREPEEAS